MASRFSRGGSYGLTLSLPRLRVINFKFPLYPHQKYFITQYEEVDFSYLTQMKDDHTTNSHGFEKPVVIHIIHYNFGARWA